MLSNGLIVRGIVHVLALRMINSCNFAADKLIIVPKVGVNVAGPAGTLVQFFTLIKTNSVNVCLNLEVIAIWGDTHALDGSIGETRRIGR